MSPFAANSLANPIDRLYNMQNSYFRSEGLTYNESSGTNEGNDSSEGSLTNKFANDTP